MFTCCILFRTLVRYKLSCDAALNSPNLVQCCETQGKYRRQGWFLLSFVCLGISGEGDCKWSLNSLHCSVSSFWWIVGERNQPHHNTHLSQESFLSCFATPEALRGAGKTPSSLGLLQDLSGVPFLTATQTASPAQEPGQKLTSIWPNAK